MGNTLRNSDGKHHIKLRLKTKKNVWEIFIASFKNIQREHGKETRDKSSYLMIKL